MPFCLELPGQLTFTTSSLKKRKIARPSRRGDDKHHARPQIHQPAGEPHEQHSPQHQLPLPAASHRPVTTRQTRRQKQKDLESVDLHNDNGYQLQPILPSTEREEVDDDDEAPLEDENSGSETSSSGADDNNDDDDDDDDDDDGNSSDLNPTFSFSVASDAASSGPTTPTYSRAGSTPLPPSRAARLGYVHDINDDSETSTPDADADGFDAASHTSSPPPTTTSLATNTNTARATLTKNNSKTTRSTRSTRSGRLATRRAAAATASALPSTSSSTTASLAAADTISQHRRKIQKHRNASSSSSTSLHPPLSSIHSRRHATHQRSHERSQSPLVPVSHRAIIMSGANDPTFQRSSSPLKRTASNMEDASDTIEQPTPSQPNSSSPLRADIKGEDVDVDMANASTDPDVAPGEKAHVKTTADTQPTAEAPPIEEQIQTIEKLVKEFNTGELEEGTAAYLVSRRWLARAQALGSGDAAKAAKEAPQGTLGPVDNADIADGIVQDIDGEKAVRLKAGTSQEDFEYFSKEAWDLLVSWHGVADGQLPIIRYAHNTAPNSMIPNVQYELHPPVFTLHRLWSAISTIPHTKEVPDVAQAAPVIMCTSNYNIQGFLRKAKTLMHIPIERNVRVWSVPRKLAAGAPSGTATPTTAASSLIPSLSTPPDSPRLAGKGAGAVSNPQDSWSKMLLEVTDFMKLQPNVEREQLSQIKDLTHDKKYNGRQTLAFISLTVDQTIVLDENVERNLWVSTYNPKTGGKDKGKSGGGHVASAVGNLANTSAARTGGANSTAASSGRSSPSHAGPVTRGRTKHKSGRTMGCVGLGNLGNTCYMNAALQCLRSVEELTKYFLVHENEAETNHSNPLGHGGNVANAYAYLLEEIFRENVPMSVAPRQFKSTIGRYAPAFAGYGQQDSQEFLGFLLDGLQEDLSRVKKKPYIEKPDSTDEMINNPAAIREMAEKVWDITKRRDDSIIADLFTGMYKSTLICPVCQKVSITFDPFTNLTLPLPIQNVWSKTIRFIPLNDRPVYLNVELDKTSSVRSFKDFISVRVGVPSDCLVAAEELRDNIIRVYDDFECVSEEMAANDSVLVYEVERTPTNNSGSKMPRKKPRSMLIFDDPEPEIPSWENPMAKSLLVPVIHRFDPGHRRRFTKSSGLACPPHFIVVTPEEARNEDVIRRKVLEKVASYSTWAYFSKAEQPTQAPSASTSTSTNTSADGSSETSNADDATDATDNDLVVTSASDVESGGDSKVIAKSVEGEDDMVDVTMKDAGAVEATAESKDDAASKILYKFNRHRPRWVTDPSMFLAGELQNLFQMGYYDDTSNLIPIKWSGSSDEKPYPSLRSRAPQPALPKRPSADRDMDSPGPWESSAGTDNEGSSPGDASSPADDNAHSSEVTRMADESDDEDSAVPPPIGMRSHQADLPKSGPARRRALKQYKARGPKGAKRRQRLPQSSAGRPARLASVEADDEGTSQGNNDDNDNDNAATPPVSSSSASAMVPANSAPLIRLGEGIMVDWSAEGWDAVFGKEGPDDEMRGEPTYEDPIPVVDDPELQEKKRNRISRKKRGLTLDECLDEFEREEILSENDMWYCPRCKEHRRASKKFDLWKTPDILVVHLKRFSSSGWRRDKLDMRVDFPVEGLDITKRVLDRQTGKEEIYDLIGVDDHWGGLGGGHYTAFAKNFIDHQWYEYNDSSVSKVSDPARVVSAAAYLLFYRRRSDVPLGGPRFAKIDERYRQETATSDDESESGEGRRLGTGSSLTGSSSASKGAEAGRRHRASPGLASSGTSSLTLNANSGKARLSSPATADDDDDDNDPDYLPPYGPSAQPSKNWKSSLNDLDDDYAATSSATGGFLNFGDKSNSNRSDNELRKSIELDDYFLGGKQNNSSHQESGSWTQQAWSFGPSDTGVGGNHNSPGSAGADVDELELGDAATATGSDSRDPDLMSLGTADHQDVDLSFLSNAVPVRRDGSESPQPPPPDMLTQANMEDIQQQVWARKSDSKASGGLVHNIALSDNGVDDASDNAVDIHVSDDEDNKMDD